MTEYGSDGILLQSYSDSHTLPQEARLALSLLSLCHQPKPFLLRQEHELGHTKKNQLEVGQKAVTVALVQLYKTIEFLLLSHPMPQTGTLSPITWKEFFTRPLLGLKPA